jgi:hypothetical protein
LYFTSLETGGRLAWRRAVWTWPYSFGALADQAQAGAEQVAQAAPLPGVGVGRREVAALEEPGDGLGVVAVALGLLAVDGLHGPGVAQREGDALVAAGVGQPVPAVHALAADDQAVAEGLHGLEEGGRGGGQVARESLLAVAVEDAEEQGPGVQVDAGVESGLGRRGEEAHEGRRFGVRGEAAGYPLHLRRREPS